MNKKSRLVLFGTGNDMKKTLPAIKEWGYTIEFFVDNDCKKWGGDYEGYEIKSPMELLVNDADDRVIVISTEKYKSQIINQLIDLGLYYDNKCISMRELEYINRSDDYLLDNGIKHTKHESDFSVLFDSQIFSLQTMGGISRYYYEIINRLVMKKDMSISLFKGINDNAFDFQPIMHLFEYYYERNNDKSSYMFKNDMNAKLIREFAAQKSKYTIYCPTYYSEYGIVNYKHMIITVYDMIHELYNIDENVSIMKKRILNRADGVVAISESTKNDLVNICNINPDKIHVVHLANSLLCDVKTHPIINGEYLLYVGVRKNYKNAITLMRAYAHSKCKDSVKLVFFGGGKFTPDEVREIEHLHIGDRVQHVAGGDDILSNLYKNAHFFIYPSKYEGFGLPLLEAMHFGTPVITSNVSSMPEVAGDAALYFNPESEDELVELLNKNVGNEAIRNSLKKRGEERERLFSWDKCCNELCDYYRGFV